MSCANERECFSLTAQKRNLLIHPVPINPIFHYVLCFLIEYNLLNCSLTEVVPAKQFTSKNANKGEKQCFTAGLHGFCCFANFFYEVYSEGDLNLLSLPAQIGNKIQWDFQTAQTSQSIQKFLHPFLIQYSLGQREKRAFISFQWGLWVQLECARTHLALNSFTTVPF